MRRVSDLLRLREVTIEGIEHTVSIHDAVTAFSEKKIHALATYDSGQLVGIFTTDELVECCHQNPTDAGNQKIADFMKANPVTTTPESDLDDVMAMMVEKETRYVPVVEGGKAVGMITALDILAHQHEILQVDHEDLMRYIRGSY